MQLRAFYLIVAIGPTLPIILDLGRRNERVLSEVSFVTVKDKLYVTRNN